MASALEVGIEVLRIAQRFVDMHEVQSNATWSRPTDSKELARLMANTGWKPGWPYCASFVEACYGFAAHAVGVRGLEDQIRRAFTPSVIRTYRNVKRLVNQLVPIPGSVFFMQKGATELGHAGLVIMSGQKTFVTIEGNTSPGVVDGASDREGDGIYFKVRRLDFSAPRTSTQLYLLGFLNPMSTIEANILMDNIRGSTT